MSKIQIKLFIKIMIKIIELKIKVMKKNLKKTVKRIIFKKIKIILINILMIDKINLTNHIIKINKIKNFLLINNFNLKTQMNNLINLYFFVFKLIPLRIQLLKVCNNPIK